MTATVSLAVTTAVTTAVTRPAVPSGDNCLIVVSAQPSPELLNRVGHNLLRAIAAGHSAPLQAAAGALDKLGRLLPDTSAESRLVAALLSLTHDQPSPTISNAQHDPAVPPQARSRRQGRGSRASKTSKAAKTSRKGQPAAQPVLDARGRLQASRRIGDVDVVSQATARQVLGMTCVQMLKLEDQRLLQRIQEAGLRYVWYQVAAVQKILDLLDRGDGSARSDDTDTPADAMA